MILDVGCGGNFSQGSGQEWEQGFMPSQFPSDVQVDIRKPKQKPVWLTPRKDGLPGWKVKKGNFVLASGEYLPFKSGAFKASQSFDVLEHVSNPYLMIREMKRVSKTVLVVTPNSLHLPSILMSIVRGKYQPHGDHIQVWSVAEMEGLLNRVGFRRFHVSFTNFHEHKAHWYIRFLMRFVPFPSLRYRALLVTASEGGD